MVPGTADAAPSSLVRARSTVLDEASSAPRSQTPPTGRRSPSTSFWNPDVGKRSTPLSSAGFALGFRWRSTPGLTKTAPAPRVRAFGPGAVPSEETLWVDAGEKEPRSGW